MQVAFLTLFLGLVKGPQPVALEAGGRVAAIELTLDGRVAARIGHSPWHAEIDFGAGLLPHHLVARGLDAGGGEVASAEQWINLPRPPAEAQILFSGAGEGQRPTARVVWQSLTGERPIGIELRLDGAPLALDAEAKAPFAVPAPGSAHVLSAELRFASGAEARKDVVLTGDWDGDVASELTAFPVRAGKSGEPLRPQGLQGRFTAAGQPLEVVTVEREPPRVFLIRAAGFIPDFVANLTAPVWRRLGPRIFKTDPRTVFHLVQPVPRTYRSAEGAAEIFDISGGAAWPQLDFREVLSAVRVPKEIQGLPRLADAVAVAGLHALAHQTPRAVVLLLGARDAADGSRFDPATVRGYLDALGVPLLVWSVGGSGRSQAAWGEVEDVSLPADLGHAYDRLEQELRSQQIVWVRGRHLPQSIALAPAAGGRQDLALVAGSRR